MFTTYRSLDGHTFFSITLFEVFGLFLPVTFVCAIDTARSPLDGALIVVCSGDDVTSACKHVMTTNHGIDLCYLDSRL